MQCSTDSIAEKQYELITDNYKFLVKQFTWKLMNSTESAEPLPSM